MDGEQFHGDADSSLGDRVTSLTGITAYGFHGVFPQERLAGQRFVVDVVWWAPAPHRADDLAAVIDYGAVGACVRDQVETDPVDLIETLAERIADTLLAAYPMTAVRVTVHKPEAPVAFQADDIAVTILRRRRTFPRQVVYSIGSNLGDRAAFLQFAVTGLETTPGIDDVRISPVYETTPVGVAAQPDYLNAVVIAHSALPAVDLLRRGLALEDLAHRVRTEAHGPRTLDVDLIAVGGETSDTAELTLPHPRAAERAFVLVPWLDIDPAATLDGVPVADLRTRLAGEARVSPTAVVLATVGGNAAGIGAQ